MRGSALDVVEDIPLHWGDIRTRPYAAMIGENTYLYATLDFFCIFGEPTTVQKVQNLALGKTIVSKVMHYLMARI